MQVVDNCVTGNGTEAVKQALLAIYYGSNLAIVTLALIERTSRSLWPVLPGDSPP